MNHRDKPKFKITFTNKVILIVDSYDQREGGIFWARETIQGYSTNDLIKSVEEIS